MHRYRFAFLLSFTVSRHCQSSTIFMTVNSTLHAVYSSTPQYSSLAYGCIPATCCRSASDLPLLSSSPLSLSKLFVFEVQSLREIRSCNYYTKQHIPTLQLSRNFISADRRHLPLVSLIKLVLVLERDISLLDLEYLYANGYWIEAWKWRKYTRKMP
jgi:hypothetical protein